MSDLKKIFGPSRKEVWDKLISELGAEYSDTGTFKKPKLVVRVNEWEITLDTVIIAQMGCTRFRAPYINKDGFRFKIHQKNIFSEMGELLGMHDIQVGSPEFDNTFVIKGNDEKQVRSLFANDKIRANMMNVQKGLFLEVKDDEGWFSQKFPDGVDELCLIIPLENDTNRLKSIYELFAEILNHLCHIGSAYEKDPKITLL